MVSGSGSTLSKKDNLNLPSKLIKGRSSFQTIDYWVEGVGLVPLPGLNIAISLLCSQSVMVPRLFISEVARFVRTGSSSNYNPRPPQMYLLRQMNPLLQTKTSDSECVWIEIGLTWADAYMYICIHICIYVHELKLGCQHLGRCGSCGAGTGHELAAKHKEEQHTNVWAVRIIRLWHFSCYVVPHGS